MIKKIKTAQLKPGMYVHEFCCSWLDHGFLFNNIRIKNDRIVEKIVTSGIQEVYIDTVKGLDVSDGQIKEDVQREIQTELTKVMKEAEPRVINSVSIQEELTIANKIKYEAMHTVRDFMENAKLGKQIEVEKADHAVEDIVNSIFRNNDALISLCRIKRVDEYLYLHSISVCVLMISFCRALNFDRKVLKRVGVGALLHDIGKIKVPPNILNKPSRLSEEEFEIVKEHVEHGINILTKTPGFSPISMHVVAEHHERYDGSGYPKGLIGEDISIYGQMAAIVDMYDAMTSDRCYQKGMEPTEVLKKLFEWGKFHFQEEMVHHFIRCVGTYPVGTLVRLESDLLCVVLEQVTKDLLHPVVRAIFDTKKNRFIKPFDIDLSKLIGKEGENIIKCHEVPEKWGINPHSFLEN